MSQDRTLFVKLQNDLNLIFTKKSFQNINVNLELGSNKGDGYIGVLVQAYISGEKNGVTKEFDAMVKCTPVNLNVRKIAPITTMFQRELLFYTKIAPIYVQIQNNMSVEEEKRFLIAKCFATLHEHGNEMMVLENLKTNGYVLMNCDKVDYKHAAIALRSLAKYHALSFSFQDRNPKEFSYISSQLPDPIFQSTKEFDNKGMTHYSEEAVKKFIDVLEVEDHKTRVMKAIKGKFLLQLAYFWGSGNIKVITHGDFWIKNVMFKYQNDDPISAILVDFQAVRYASVVNDLTYFSGTSWNDGLRSKFFWELVDEYYFSLSEFLKKLGYDVKKFCTYDQFKEEIKSQAVFGLLASIFALPFFTSDEVYEFNDIFTMSLPDSFYKHATEYSRRVNEFVTDYVNFGFI